MSIVEALSKEPHPTGTLQSVATREVVVKALERLGLAPEVQAPRGRRSTLRNVVARRKGRGQAGKKALLLCAHYDSVPNGPGAGDDASGVAVILETLRALDNGPPLERDVIVLIDDGEESGLLGAALFVAEHAWAKDIGVVLNFDARGCSGPVFMFETSEENGWLVRQFARACARPLATSLSMDVYRIMPNDTDLTIFKRAGLAGLNFAFGGGQYVYHTRDDTAVNLDPRTLQHEGDCSLAVSRRFGGLDLDEPTGEDVIYTSLLGRVVVYYPRSWAWPIALTTAAAFLVVLVIGLVRRRVRAADLAAGIATWLVAAVAAVFAVGGFWVVLRDIFDSVGVPWLRIELPIMTACAVVASVVALAVEARVLRHRSPEALTLGALAWWLVLALASARWMAGSSYLFAWPLLFALAGLGVAMVARVGSITARVATLLGAIPTLILMPPLVRNTFDGLGVRLAGPLMLLIVLTVGAILPLLTPVLGVGRQEARAAGSASDPT